MLNPKHFSSALALFITLLPVALATLPSLAKAEDFYHRDNRGRRMQDWGRGFQDGTDCRKLLQKVRVSLCQDYRNYYKCGQSSTAEYYQLVMDVNQYGSQGTKYMFNQYLHCKGERQTAFDRDTQRQSNDWHQRNPDRR